MLLISNKIGYTRSTRNVYLMCEYCNGGSLKEYIKNKIYLTEK